MKDTVQRLNFAESNENKGLAEILSRLTIPLPEFQLSILYRAIEHTNEVIGAKYHSISKELADSLEYSLQWRRKVIEDMSARSSNSAISVPFDLEEYNKTLKERYASLLDSVLNLYTMVKKI